MNPIKTHFFATALFTAGCRFSAQPPAPPTTPTTNPAALATTQPYYYTTQPAVAIVRSTNYQHLWDACVRAAKDFGFEIDREDYRTGLLTTRPLISRQFWEVWRRDVVTASGVTDASLATHRRTIRFEFERKDGLFEVSPYVIIERYARAEQPIAADIYLRSSLVTRKHPALGTKETDRAVYLPSSYWYATGRDTALERQLAKQVQQVLAKK
jgi:hypothetical protein